ncbi:MAG TPA: hypothetical protein VNO33_16385, partial [Kofleriaceae bacterium]|nr:hypothetical protein [Kofleriaceae bacterium]
MPGSRRSGEREGAAPGDEAVESIDVDLEMDDEEEAIGGKRKSGRHQSESAGSDPGSRADSEAGSSLETDSSPEASSPEDPEASAPETGPDPEPEDGAPEEAAEDEAGLESGPERAGSSSGSSPEPDQPDHDDDEEELGEDDQLRADDDDEESIDIEQLELVDDDDQDDDRELREDLAALHVGPEAASGEPEPDTHWSVPSRAPRARTVTSAPPPPPAPRPRASTSPMTFEVTPPSAAAEPGISPEFRAAYEASPLPEGAPPPDAAPDPLARPLESPSVLERLVAELEQGSSPSRVDVLSRELSLPPDQPGAMSKERLAALAYEFGELCERQLDDEARAVKAFGRALQADPTLLPNLWAIRRVFYRRGLWPNLIKLISAETRLAASEPARADLLVEKGHILEDQLGDPAGAGEAYEQAVQADQTCLPALAGLERLALRRADDAALEHVWPLLAQASETPARKQAYYLDLVRLCGERGGDELERARDFMARAAQAGNLGERGARLREWLAERSGDAGELLAALDVRATELLARFGPAGPAARRATEAGDLSETEGASRLRRQIVAVRRRQARVAVHQLGDADRAWGYLQQATALLPGEHLLIADLADLAERLGKYDELAELVEGWESEESDPARALSLALRRADALFRGGHAEAARALLGTLAASQPPYLPILALRERDALGRADATALAETYVAAGEAAESGAGFGPGATSEPDPRAAAAHFLV